METTLSVKLESSKLRIATFHTRVKRLTVLTRHCGWLWQYYLHLTLRQEPLLPLAAIEAKELLFKNVCSNWRLEFCLRVLFQAAEVCYLVCCCHQVQEMQSSSRPRRLHNQDVAVAKSFEFCIILYHSFLADFFVEKVKICNKLCVNICHLRTPEIPTPLISCVQ
jgi:hypothetical protein